MPLFDAVKAPIMEDNRQNSDPYRVYVSNIPYDATEESLAKVFSDSCEVTRLEKAWLKSGEAIGDRYLGVQEAHARTVREPWAPQEARSDPGSDPTDTLFIANIPFECTRDELVYAYAVYGQVLSSRMPKDRETGRHRGCVFH